MAPLSSKEFIGHGSLFSLGLDETANTLESELGDVVGTTNKGREV